MIRELLPRSLWSPGSYRRISGLVEKLLQTNKKRTYAFYILQKSKGHIHIWIYVTMKRITAPFPSWSALQGALQEWTAFCCLCWALGKQQTFSCLQNVEIMYIFLIKRQFYITWSEQTWHCYHIHFCGNREESLTYFFKSVQRSADQSNHKICCCYINMITPTFDCRWWRHPLRFIIFLDRLTHKCQRRFRLVLSVWLIRTC